MAATEEPEVQFAQRLACNERSVRTKALRKLRKYIGVRSHGTTGGFTDVELLKLWKGLFYCLWMQDKPLMQEELSRNVSTLIHSFHRFDTQLLYFVSFLQTVKREWTGIDRLRMDKFFQLVRFMFRQTFERLKRNGWDGGEVGRFVEVLKAELLQGSGGAPSGLQLHVLDLYLTELAAVGAVELTAAQNLTFIEPFCKTAAKTKDRTLFGAVCSGVFSVIIDQAPFAIQDLMKELEAAESDSGQASEEEEEEEEETPAGKNKKHKASKSKEEGEDDEDELLDLDDPDGELQDDIGPVLQFDYSAVADKLLELSSRSGTPGPNRQRLYRIVKVLRDLSEGVFPQAECPEEVSTDEDDDMFATRKKLKGMKRRGLIDADLGDSPAAKKMKKKKKKEEEEDGEPANEKRKKKKKKKKRKKRAGVDNGEMENGCGESECSVKESPEGAAVAVEVSEDPPPAEPTVQSQEEVDGGDEGDGGDVSPDKGSPATKKRRKRKKKKKAAPAALTGEEELSQGACEAAAPPQAETDNGGEKTDGEAPAAGSPETLVKTPAKKKNKKKKEPETKRMTDSEQEVAPLGAGDATPAPEKEEVEGLRAELQPQAGAQVNGVSSDTLKKKKSKRKGLKLPQRAAAAGEGEEETPGEAEGVEEPQEVTKAAKRKKRKIPVVFEFEADELEEVPPGQQQTPPTGQKKKKKKKVSGAPKSDFVSFQSRAAVPTPLFCRTRKSGPNEKTLRTGKSPAPDSGSKKVTFGLKNNKTAEFKKTDRSLLLSPDGSSRVPFDPAQKPKCGVLKSPPVTRLAAARRASLAAANSAAKPRRRPAAADFF